VIVKADISVYPPRGNYQLICREMNLIGVGKLLLELEKLKQKLWQKGYFAPERKRAIPKFAKRIGVVTSPTGAVIRDIINILTRRFKGFSLLLNPVKVQGEGAAQEIARAIEDFNRFNLVDVIICGRGGGSIEDLWAFNEEIVADAIFKSRIPIISAVGHETDTCIADWVADLRAPTPSAAAELVSHEKSQKLKELSTLEERLFERMDYKIRQRKLQLQSIERLPVLSSSYSLFSTPLQKIDEWRLLFDLKVKEALKHRLYEISLRKEQVNALQPIRRIQNSISQLCQLQKGIDQALLQKRQKKGWLLKSQQASLLQIMRRKSSLMKQFDAQQLRQKLDHLLQRLLQDKRGKKEQVTALLASLDPKNVLKKGYSIIFAEKDSKVVSSVAQFSSGQSLRILLQDGEAKVQVADVHIKK
ncbi:MAG: xseA, partial [Chlamydiales bacterium]|nr:xseA [Chlamydiales bacterium]